MVESYDHALRVNGFAHPHALAADGLAAAYEGCRRFADAVPLRRQLRDHYRAAGNADLTDRHANY